MESHIVLTWIIPPRRPRITRRVSLILLMMGMTANGWAHAAAQQLLFTPGEKFTYTLRWEFIPAGEATLEVMPLTTFDGIPAFHFVMTARSTPAIDYIYKVRNRIEAFTDVQMTRSLHYRKKQREGRHERDVEVCFDWNRKTARYANFGKSKDPIELMPGTFDPLSAFYFTRMADLKENTVIRRPLTDGKKNVMGELSVIRRETIVVQDKPYDVFLVEPDMKHIGGVFEKTRDARIHIWLTTDARHIPVRIQSKVIVGSFVVELASEDPPPTP